MKKILTILIVLGSTPVVRAQNDIWKNIFLFGAGYFTGHLAHETGHYASAALMGVPSITVWNWNQFPPLSSLSSQSYGSTKNANIAAAGFYAEVISSEIILDSPLSDKVDEGDPFLLGWLAMTVVNPILYTVRDDITRGGWGDYQVLRYEKWNTNYIKIFMLTHAALTLTRVVLKLEKDKTLEVTSTPMSVSLTVNF